MKLKFISKRIIHNFWNFSYVDWVFLASDGVSSSVLVMRDRRVVVKLKDFIIKYIIACYFRNMEYSFSWTFAEVYGSNVDS